jgi:hypothetical protein
MKPFPKFIGKSFIPNWVLNQVCTWIANFQGDNGISFRYEEGRVVCTISPYVLVAAAAEATAFQWKLWGRMNGAQLEYAVNAGLWDGSSWSSANAGNYIDPIGSTHSASAKAWTSGTAGGVYVHFSCSAGSVTVTIDQTAGSDSSFYASPGILNVRIGTLNADGTCVQEMAPGTFTMSQVPAFFAGYAPASIQSFQHLANAAPSFDTDGDCDA